MTSELAYISCVYLVAALGIFEQLLVVSVGVCGCVVD